MVATLGIRHVLGGQLALTEVSGCLRYRPAGAATTIDGDLNDIPAALTPSIRAAIGETCANIERHADPDHPCSIVVSVDDNAVDAVFLNQTPPGGAARTSLGVGLIGLAERLALVGGELTVEQEGSQWISRVTIPR